MSTEDRFKAAVNVIRNLPSKGSFQPSTDLQLKFYSYFKQATEGPCTVGKPSFWDVVGKAKWDAWKNLGDMAKEEAMEKYVDELKKVIGKLKQEHGHDESKIIETMSYTESVSQFMDLLGPFYEVVPLSKSNSQPLLNGEKESLEYVSSFGNSSSYHLYQKMKNSKDSGKVNGFGEQAESDGDEFSDTYDHIKESASLAVEGGGKNGGDNGYGSDAYLDEVCENNNNEVQNTPNGSLSVEPLLIDSVVKLKKKSDLFKKDNEDSQPNLSRDYSPNLASIFENGRNGDSNGDSEREEYEIIDVENKLDNMISQARGGDQSVIVPRSSGGDLGAGSISAGGNRAVRARNQRDSSLQFGSDIVQVAGGSGGSGMPGSSGSFSGSAGVNEQLALAVIKLQNSLDEINSRLSVLEQGLASKKRKGLLPSFFQNMGISPQLLLLILAWPFVAQWLIHAARKRQGFKY